MDKLLDPNALGMFLTFFVPGIIVLYFRSLFLNGKMPPLAEGVIGYVTLSLLYQAALFVSAKWLSLKIYPLSDSPLLWFAFLFVIPAILGTLLGQDIRQGWTRKCFAKFGLHIAHPVDCAWDWRFAGSAPAWALIVLKDGTEWAGFLGRNSFMSSSPSERDIYIEKIYDLDDAKTWHPRESGVWLCRTEIQSIELWPEQQEKKET